MLTAADNDEEYDINMLASLLDADEDPNLDEAQPTTTMTTPTNKEESKRTPDLTKTTMAHISTTEDIETELKKLQGRMSYLQQQLNHKKQTEQQKKTESIQMPKLRDVGLIDFFNEKSSVSNSKSSATPTATGKVRSSVIHSGDTDSSDDETNRNPMSTKYNEFGQFVRQRLAHTSKYDDSHPSVRYKSKPNSTTNSALKPEAISAQVETTDIYSGIRIINPRVSSAEMRERMTGRKMIHLSTIRLHIRSGDIEGDWVTIGVIVNKTDPKKSSKGSLYSIWKICDLKDCSKVVSVFLFGKNHEQHWKTAVGSVIGILNASMMPNKDSVCRLQNGNNNDVCLTFDNPQKLMLMGVSKDFGICKGRRKDGATCTMFINKADCEVCPFHIQKEYRKSSSKRMDLQASYSGPEPSGVRAKIMQNHQIMYGGQLYVNPRPDKSRKAVVKGKDKLTLNNLKLQTKATDLAKSERAIINASYLSTEENKIINNIGNQCEAFGKMMCVPTAGSRNLFRHLKSEDIVTSSSSNTRPSEFKSITPSELLKMHAKEMEIKRTSGQLSNTIRSATTFINENSKATVSPKLGKDLRPGDAVILDVPVLKTHSSPSLMDYAKLKAIKKIVKPIVKDDPNAIKPDRNSTDFKNKIKKRLANESQENLADEEPLGKKPRSEKLNVQSEKFLEILNRKSKYDNLVEEENSKREDKYFKEMEKKEQIETKMCSTMEMQCRAVSCKKCEYTAFSALDTCRSEGHPLIVHKATKRFFKCKDCSRRVVSLSKLPNKPCSGCRGNNYEKVAMCKERKGPTLESEKLSIRGGEQLFIASHCTENLNL